MLGTANVHPTLPAVDMGRAKKFYQEVLGLKLAGEDPTGGTMFKAGQTYIYLYPRGVTKADHTVAEFDVDDIEAEVKELRAKGVTFQDLDMPDMGIKTVNGVATITMPEGELKAAWFTDTEGNILAIQSIPKAMRDKFMSGA